MKLPLTFPRFFWFWARINRNPWRRPSELRNLQEKMFKSVLRHAYENTVFYYRLYRQHGIRPDDIKSLDDIRKLPVVFKEDLKQCSIEERFSRSFDIRRCREARTSGSTGEPFRIYSEPRAVDYLHALHLRRLFIYGYKPWYTIVILGPFWAPGIPTLKRRAIRPGFLNTFDFDANGLSASDDPYENVSYLRAIKPQVIWSPPSYMRLLAEAVSKSGVNDIKPRTIICGAEMLDPAARPLIESTFGVKVFDEYGTVDVASRAIAWQCDKHEGYHINMDSVYLELINDDGDPVSAGEKGYIVATNLFRYATPMIRYMIGDVGVLSGERCSCGRSFPLIESIEGRSDDFLVMPDGRLISPFSAMVVLEDIPSIRRYQIIQEKVDRIVLFVEPASRSTNVAEEVNSKCSQLFGDGVEVEIVLGPINIVRGRKHRIVTSKVPASLRKLH